MEQGPLLRTNNLEMNIKKEIKQDMREEHVVVIFVFSKIEIL